MSFTGLLFDSSARQHNQATVPVPAPPGLPWSPALAPGFPAPAPGLSGDTYWIRSDGTLIEAPPQSIPLAVWSVVADGVSGTVTVAGNIVTATSPTWTPADQGKQIAIFNATAAGFGWGVGTIQQFNTSRQVTLAAAMGGNAAGVIGYWASDQSAKINAAITAVQQATNTITCAELVAPGGMIGLNGTVNLSNTNAPVRLGGSPGVGNPNNTPTGGTTFLQFSAGTSFSSATSGAGTLNGIHLQRFTVANFQPLGANTASIYWENVNGVSSMTDVCVIGCGKNSANTGMTPGNIANVGIGFWVDNPAAASITLERCWARFFNSTVPNQAPHGGEGFRFGASLSGDVNSGQITTIACRADGCMVGIYHPDGGAPGGGQFDGCTHITPKIVFGAGGHIGIHIAGDNQDAHTIITPHIEGYGFDASGSVGYGVYFQACSGVTVISPKMAGSQNFIAGDGSAAFVFDTLAGNTPANANTVVGAQLSRWDYGVRSVGGAKGNWVSAYWYGGYTPGTAMFSDSTGNLSNNYLLDESNPTQTFADLTLDANITNTGGSYPHGGVSRGPDGSIQFRGQLTVGAAITANTNIFQIPVPAAGSFPFGSEIRFPWPKIVTAWKLSAGVYSQIPLKINAGSAPQVATLTALANGDVIWLDSCQTDSSP